MNGFQSIGMIAGVVVALLVVLPIIVSQFLRDVNAGEIRLVSWLQGSTVIYRGPGKSKEIPLLTTGTTIPSAAINVDIDITDQTADIGDDGIPRPIKVQVLSSAIVSVGDSDEMIKTAANRFFSKPQDEQMSTLIDLLTSSGRRAVNLLTHDQLFSAKTAVRTQPALGAGNSDGSAVTIAQRAPLAVSPGIADEEDDDPLSIIIRKACSKELTDLGLTFNSLNIKVVRSDVAEARRRQSAAEATANAEIVEAQQKRRAQEARLEAEKVINDKQRELAQTQAQNAAMIAQAEAKRQTALGEQRTAELQATQIAQSKADAQRRQIEAEADAIAEAIKITKIAEAQADAIRKVNDAVRDGGENYLRLKQLEMIPMIAPAIGEALSRAKLITFSSGGEDGGAAGSAASNLMGVVQTILAADMLRGGMQQADDKGVSAPKNALPSALEDTKPPAKR
ncbi:MAG: hypothetical protein JWO05_23 [Gemmatimonadetes bacterium]|nr:hypothetical protein [Gemmatimonadota bacterium]